MLFRGKQLEDITEADLEALVEGQVSETKTIEYKQALPARSDSAKKEFLADVSSLANAGGGHLVYGIREEEGVPQEICGLEVTNVDAETLRLESMMRDGIDPRIPATKVSHVPMASDKVAIVIEIPRSWAGPHRVIFSGHDKFYSRNSAGKYPLDVDELRAAFLLSETAAKRIRNFRAERLAKIVADETPVPVRDNPKVVLHLVPLGASQSTTGVDISVAQDSEFFRPLFGSITIRRYNFDGLLASYNRPADSYLQLFRNGALEMVDALVMKSEDRSIPSRTFEEELVKGMGRYLSLEKQLGMEPPLFVLLTLLGVHGYDMGVMRGFPRTPQEEERTIDRDILNISEILVEDLDTDVPKLMKPAFDAVWNAAGWSGSRYYDAGGNWTLRQNQPS